MSTYLLFLAVGGFERVHQVVDGVDLGVLVKHGDTEKAAYALAQATKLLHYYNSYFGLPYPLPKLDLVAAPGQISGGSMENWGAVFYSQDQLLIDPARSTEADRQLVFQVVAHEMAHQWFGDLVTMEWWDNLWLNEGFARWMQTYAADALHPEWKMGLRALSIFEAGKAADAGPSTHPVVQPVLTADQASEAFDAITYDKGAAVITMINAYVGRDAFRDGVRRYMRAHAYGNTVDSDLWGEIQRMTGKPVLDIERDATRQPGVPLVKMELVGSGVKLSEGSFANNPDAIIVTKEPRWRLPISVKPLGGGLAKTALLTNTIEVAARSPVLVNAGQTAYARVIYPQRSFGGLTANFATLSPADQLGILNDTLALGLAGYEPVSNVLALVRKTQLTADPVVWERIVDILQEIDRHYSDGPRRSGYRRFVLAILNPLSRQIGRSSRTGEDGNVEILRAALNRLEGLFGDTDALAWAKSILASATEDASAKRTALIVVAGQADEATFVRLLTQARDQRDPLEKQRTYQALAGVQDPRLAARMVDIAFSDEPPAGTGPYLLGSIIDNHPDLAWKLAMPYLLNVRQPLSNNMRWGLVVRLASASALQERIVDVQAYVSDNVPADARRPFLGAIASIRQNQRIAKNAIPDIDQWLTDRRAGARLISVGVNDHNLIVPR